MKTISPLVVTFGVVAVAMALVAAYIVKQSLTPPIVAGPPPQTPEVEPPPEPPLVRIVYARKNIASGDLVELEDVDVKSIPEKDYQEKKRDDVSYFSHPGVAVGRIAKVPIKAGRLLAEEMFEPIGQLPTTSGKIPEGRVAVTVSVAGSHLDLGLLDEGSFVNLAYTVSGEHPDLGGTATKTILERVPVITAAVGDSQGEQTNSLTVAVKPADANMLITAAQSGLLSATLVSAHSAESPAVTENMFTEASIFNLREIEEPVEPEPDPPFVAESWNGSELTVFEFTEGRRK
ncbi:MAG: Flp pilus assembly protein CpaB [Pirellulaceae bacterium]|nr:Flp pilus assembly protein CpaB [Pirellulaceae bacterium]